MKKILLPLFCCLLLVAIGPRTVAAASLSVKDAVTAAADFPLLVNGRAATLVVDSNDAVTWQRHVLRGAMYGCATLRVPQGSYALKVWAADCGVVLQQISVNAL
ncbi:MAG: hypothetical protein ABIZ81_02010 [Opitutaceae bacterium]